MEDVRTIGNRESAKEKEAEVVLSEKKRQKILPRE